MFIRKTDQFVSHNQNLGRPGKSRNVTASSEIKKKKQKENKKYYQILVFEKRGQTLNLE